MRVLAGSQSDEEPLVDVAVVVISSAFWGVFSVHEGAFCPRPRRVTSSGVFTSSL